MMLLACSTATTWPDAVMVVGGAFAGVAALWVFLKEL